MPGGMKREALAVDESSGVSVLCMDWAAARVGDAMDTERITDAAVTSSVTSLSATWAPIAKDLMIELLTYTHVHVSDNEPVSEYVGK